MVSRYLHVVAATIFDSRNQVLIARRPGNTHQGGKWEFPGGKVEQGETATQALSRELNEELGIQPLVCEPLIKVRHDYLDRAVLLDVWRVTQFKGVPHGREGQPVTWVALAELQRFTFPQANLPILKALRLPETYLITPQSPVSWRDFLFNLERLLRQGQKLIRFRAKTFSTEAYVQYAQEVIRLCHDYSARVLVDYAPQWRGLFTADGVHLSSRWLMEVHQRPFTKGILLAASCHDKVEIEKANLIQADFIVLSPIRYTTSHQDARVLGWETFGALCEAAAMPVYALGGMRPRDIRTARRYGGQGIAAIRSLWSENTSSN
jgi:8-oxo-dGTP diphosphatase